MIRRRRPVREIAFSFDSFLDLVTNVVGIILRLILVAWVGARSYKAFVPPPPPPPALEELAEFPEPTDPLTPELERQRRELAAAQKQLLDQLRQWDVVRQEGTAAARDFASVTARQHALRDEQARAERSAQERGASAQALTLSIAELRARNQRVREELEALRKLPSPKKTLRYRTPVSQPLQTEELLFECRKGRVTLIDIGALLQEVRRGMRGKEDLLRHQWQVEDTTRPVGAFRLRYVLERERGPLEGSGAGPPDGQSNFRYGLAGWEVEPITLDRGEAADAALAPGSVFRRIADSLEPQQTAVTMWVYADSFALYRRLRDYLHEHDVVVAGRPLPDGYPIASSRRGTVSRGQ